MRISDWSSDVCSSDLPFGFERLRDHNARHWRDIKDEARSHIATQLESPIVGYDLDPRAIEAATANLERAWLTPDSIRFEIGDRSEERRVGNECVSTCRSRWSP